MPKLYSARIILSALQRAGFSVVSQKGSHIKLHRTTNGESFIVIVPNYKEVARGTFHSILKQAGMTNEVLKSYIK